LKKFLKILLGFFVFIAIVVTAALFFTSDMTTAADDFFLAVQEQDMAKAYSHLSKDFQAGTSEEELTQYLQSTSIAKVVSSSWSSRTVNLGKGKLEGSLTTDTGAEFPVTLELVKEDDQWKIYSLFKPASGLKSSKVNLQLPENEVLYALIDKSVGVFAQAVDEQSMGTFHANISRVWQSQTTVGQLDEAFGVFYGSNLSFDEVGTVQPALTSSPNISENGVLQVEGYYPSESQQIYFGHKYIYEESEWKLLGFNLQVK